MLRFTSLSVLVAIGALLILAATCSSSTLAFEAQFAPAAASGCTPARPHASGTSVQTITTVDGVRSYRLHVPPSYTGSTALPLVFNIHGATSNAAEQELYSGFSTKADAAGFIVVYPDGLSTTAIPYTHFNAWMLPSPEPDDLRFMTSVLDTLEAQLCVDATSVYSTGMSNGAIMSVRLACSLSRRIAAIGPVAGAYYPPDATNINPVETCPDTTPVPMIAFHGTADTVVPFNGGLGGVSGTTNFRLPIDDNTPAEDVLSDWSSHNGCTGSRQESQITSEVRLVQYGGCALGATVELYAVDGGGHTWPGAANVMSLGYTTHQISATDFIWAFFAAHPMAAAAPAAVGGVAQAPELGAVTAGSRDRSRYAFVLGVFAIAVVLGGGAWWVRRRVHD
jgi:polyhydroxybutyrate depolymerase